jgi:RNA-directed DNA polymerase
VNDKDSENNLAAVPKETAQAQQEAKQAKEIHGRWPWVERSVWSDRMLEALENGVRGGKWFSLIDKVWKEDNLSAAWLKTTLNGGSPGVDGQTVRQFTAHLDKELKTLQRQLMEGSYTPQPVRRCWIPKLGSKEKRPLGVPTVSS